MPILCVSTAFSTFCVHDLEFELLPQHSAAVPPPHRIRLVVGVPVPGVLDGWMLVEFCLRLLVGMLWSFLKLKPSKPCICRKTQDLEQG